MKMKWSWKLGRIAGIDIYLHTTFLILIVWIISASVFSGGSMLDAVIGVLFITSIFSFVVLHELGHALTARRFGIRTRDITLLPIGGIASIMSMPEKPRQELSIALAGPAVNIVLAAVFLLAVLILNSFLQNTWIGATALSFLFLLMKVNIALAIFNLLPAFPMDGGRVIRALMSMRMPHLRATEIAAAIGKVMAVLLGLLGLLGMFGLLESFDNPFLIVIAFFIWFAGSAEVAALRMKARQENLFNWNIDTEGGFQPRPDTGKVHVSTKRPFSYWIFYQR